MSDNPRPQLYEARYTALLANRADEEPEREFTIAGKHCESGDVLIERVELPGAAPRRPARRPGDRRVHARDELELQRPHRAPPRCSSAAARRRLILRRETIDDLLAREV